MKVTSNNKHKIIDKKCFSKIVLQTFVWMLVIAFVSTIGVMWDDNGMGYPVVLESSIGKVDLSPRNLYMLEYDRIDDQLKVNDANIDPRVYARYLQNITLTNTTASFIRNSLYEDMKIKPSLKMKQEIQNNTGLPANVVEFQYGESYYRSALGIIPILSSPTVSDMYVIDNLKDFNIATEILVLNQTNFLLAKISEEDKAKYYEQNFIDWLDEVEVQDFKVENRGQARRVINMLKEKGIEETIKELNTNKDWVKKVVIKNNLKLTAQKETFSHLINVLKAYKNKNSDDSIVITDPIYNNGKYHVSVLNSILSFDQLKSSTQRDVTIDYLTKNYNKILKMYRSEWKNTVKLFDQQIEVKAGFSLIADEVLGTVHHTTQPFNMLQISVTNVLGEALALPILTDPIVLKNIFETSVMETSTIIRPKFAKNLLIVVRPLDKSYNKNVKNTEELLQDQNFQKNVFVYKQNIFERSLSSELLKKRYNIKIYPKVLSNLNPRY